MSRCFCIHEDRDCFREAWHSRREGSYRRPLCCSCFIGGCRSWEFPACTHDGQPRRPFVGRYQLSTWDRFWTKVRKSEGCWEWTGSISGKPLKYGRFRAGGKGQVAHRVAWELLICPIPDGLHVLHRCDNPVCVKPTHLFLGTAEDNASDKVKKGRQSCCHQPGWRNFRKYTPEFVEQVRRLLAEDPSPARIAKNLGCDSEFVRRIHRGLIWNCPRGFKHEIEVQG